MLRSILHEAGLIFGFVVFSAFLALHVVGNTPEHASEDSLNRIKEIAQNFIS